MGLSHKDQEGRKNLSLKKAQNICHHPTLEQSALKLKSCQEISIAALLALRCGPFYSCKGWHGTGCFKNLGV